MDFFKEMISDFNGNICTDYNRRNRKRKLDLRNMVELINGNAAVFMKNITAIMMREYETPEIILVFMWFILSNKVLPRAKKCRGANL